jgi:hypothetical protein
LHDDDYYKQVTQSYYKMNTTITNQNAFNIFTSIFSTPVKGLQSLREFTSNSATKTIQSLKGYRSIVINVGFSKKKCDNTNVVDNSISRKNLSNTLPLSVPTSLLSHSSTLSPSSTLLSSSTLSPSSTVDDISVQDNTPLSSCQTQQRKKHVMKDLKKIRQHGPILKRRSNTQNKRKLEKKRTINRLTEVETPELIEVYDIGSYIFVEDETHPSRPTDWGGYAFVIQNQVDGMYTVEYTLNKNIKSVAANRCKLCKFNNDRGILRQVQKP